MAQFKMRPAGSYSQKSLRKPSDDRSPIQECKGFIVLFFYSTLWGRIKAVLAEDEFAK
jgi:hypothetical protein